LPTSYLLGEDGVRKSPKTALTYFLEAEKLGHWIAMTDIARCYIELRDFKMAKQWLDKAVSLSSDEDAYAGLGYLHEKGLGVPRSKAIALGYYITAGDLGSYDARKDAVRLRGKPIVFYPQGSI
jgi:TPR repeat protein